MMTTWLRIAAALAIVSLIGTVAYEIRTGAVAKAEVKRLNGELSAATLLVQRRTDDLTAQLRMVKASVERAAREDAVASSFEAHVNDFGSAVSVPPLVERTLKETFP